MNQTTMVTRLLPHPYPRVIDGFASVFLDFARVNGIDLRKPLVILFFLDFDGDKLKRRVEWDARQGKHGQCTGKWPWPNLK